jgi:hypothetical protein
MYNKDYIMITLTRKNLYNPLKRGWTRIIASLFLALVSFVLVSNPHFLLTSPGGDFGWAIRAARDLVNRSDPYNYSFDINHIPYPLIAAFVGLPFIKMLNSIAGAVFFSASTFLLALGMTRNGQYWKLLFFLSYPYIEAARCVQWAVLIMCIPFYSDLLFLAFAKPHIGIPATLLEKPTHRGLIISLTVIAFSLIIYPLWPLRWISQIGQFGGYIPILLPFGFLLLLSALVIKTPKGRYLFLLSILPKRAFYDSAMLFLIPESKREMLVMVLISWLAFSRYLVPHPFYNPAVIIYLFSLFMVLSHSSKFWLKQKQKLSINKKGDAVILVCSNFDASSTNTRLPLR